MTTSSPGLDARAARLAPDPRDPLTRARLLAPLDLLLRIPEFRPGLVRRPDRVRRLIDGAAPPVVVISAPPGYGKTTLLAEWAEADPRPFAWVSITEGLDSPSVLLAYLVRAFDSLEPLDDLTLAGLTRPDADLTTSLLPRLAALLAARAEPFVLVLDDVHLLRSPDCAKVLAALTEHVPLGAQLALVGRGDPPRLISRLRASRRLVHLGVDDLALRADEGAALVVSAGVELEPATMAEFVAGSEGWPAGLYLATISIGRQRDVEQAATDFAGADRLVADLLRDELLGSLPDDVVEFLTRASVLEPFSGELCDAVLEWSGAAELIDELARSNLLVIPLDSRTEWYRYHHFFRDLLQAELRRREPALESPLHERASRWYEARGEADLAIRHAYASGDVERTAALVWQVAPAYFGTGRGAVVQQWLDLFDDGQLTRSPELALAAAWRGVTGGDAEMVSYWLSVAERVDAGELLSDQTPRRAAVALLRAVIGRGGLDEMERDAAIASELDRESSWRAIALGLCGVATRLTGDLGAARVQIDDALRLAGPRLATLRALMLAELALVEIQAEDWLEAGRCIDQLRELVAEYGLREQPPQALAYAISALAFARAGATDEARREWQQSRQLLALLRGILPWLALETRELLARASLLLGDVAAARLLVREAESLLARSPGWNALERRLDEVCRAASEITNAAGLAATPLTTAELRVLRYLPTHLSLAAIADELFVSRNTVKTHAISIYRKLGVSSRPAAVGRARDLGLLEAG